MRRPAGGLRGIPGRLPLLTSRVGKGPFPGYVQAYVTEGEICDVLREVFGEYQAARHSPL